MARAGEHRPDRQQLLHLRRRRGQRRARRRVARRADGVPEGDPRRRDPHPARLHPADAGDLDRRAVDGHQPHRRGDAGVQIPPRPLRPRRRRARHRHRASGRLGQRAAGLAHGPVDRAPRHRPRARLSAAVLPEGQRQRRPGSHPRRPRNRDHPDRAAVRADPERVAGLLDLRRPGHRGLPDHVRPDVRGGPQSPAAPTRARTRLSSPAAGDDRSAQSGRSLRSAPA